MFEFTVAHAAKIAVNLLLAREIYDSIKTALSEGSVEGHYKISSSIQTFRGKSKILISKNE